MSEALHELAARQWLCALLHQNGTDPRAALAAEHTPEFWQAASRIAVGHGLAPLLARHESLALWPEGCRNTLEEARRFTLASNVLQLDAGNALLEAFARAGIAALPIKGLALLREKIYAPGERPMTDIDILVCASDLPRARDCATESGWQPVDCSDEARLRHHHWTLVLPGTPPVGLDLHWTPTSGERILPAWDALQLPDAGDPMIAVLLYFLATNTARHGYTGKLLFLHDIARILHTRRDDIDWGHLEVLALQTGTRRAIALALACAASAFGPEPPAFSGFGLGAYERRLLASLWPTSRWESRWGGRALRIAAADSPTHSLRVGTKGLFNLLRRNS